MQNELPPEEITSQIMLEIQDDQELIQTPAGQFKSKKDGQDLILESEGNTTLEPNEEINFIVNTRKIPNQIEVDGRIDRVVIDRENYGENMSRMVEACQALKELPESERPEKVLDILLENMKYAYKDFVAQIDEERQTWIAEHLTTRNYATEDIPVSQLAEVGFCVCRHFAAMYLILAKEAGLDGCYMGAQTNFTNLERKPTDRVSNDGRKGLFRSGEVGSIVNVGHAWAEVLVHNGEEESWVPVCPSTQLIGNTPERLQTFIDAGFVVPAFEKGLKINLSSNHGEIPESVSFTAKESYIYPGENLSLVNLTLSNQKSEILGIGTPSRTIEPVLFQGNLTAKIVPHEFIFNSSAKLEPMDIDVLPIETR